MNSFKETDLPKHPCLTLISNCLQTLTMRWGRRLITMEKTLEFNPIDHDKSKLTKWDLGQIEPQHGDLRTKVYHKATGEKEKSKKQLKKERKKEAFELLKLERKNNIANGQNKNNHHKNNLNNNNENNDSNNNNNDNNDNNETPTTTTTTNLNLLRATFEKWSSQDRSSSEGKVNSRSKRYGDAIY
ncbi:hypothetical protein PPL_09621 [Heterostelium album PN500]|uniref:Uncharacterized protein n=1 Tax=Heterostelium pallidum (strain ATCC 26659 / Pp 5 / PN500) TaxID=670386 RepID=D3BNV0_HETP5|nr:hypothetical protein PPL_09621 [Heterostelium album PN500]EFA76869.1 hypothetical protein PPL_09621 [Heterostelium album PN500]|eukprot:XP_020429001.1 hypothetical protein PPL_09621 [Heterostelium album PN500]